MKEKDAKSSIGVIFHPAFPPESLIDFSRKAEAGGFDELWLWDDCFTPGALTSAGIALASTRQLKVGIGLMPATVYHPLFAAMEITTLARAFPGRILPGFGHGLGVWMKQIGAAPPSSLAAIDEVLTTVGALLKGDLVTMHGTHVKVDNCQMSATPEIVPPLLLGGMRKRTLQLAGRVADGSILPHFSSIAYIEWVKNHIRQGMEQSGKNEHHLVVYLAVKVNPDGEKARKAMREWFARQLKFCDIQLEILGIENDVHQLLNHCSEEELPDQIPDEWIDQLAVAGTPEQVAEGIQHWMDAGVDSLVFQPLDGDADCLDEYCQFLMPLLRD